MGFLKAIEDGTVSLRTEFDPQDTYAGNVPYVASNGWRITIFNDCNDWDYVDRVETPDGRRLDFDAIDNYMPAAREYMPSDELAWLRYGIPGYCIFRCTVCSAELLDRDARRVPFVCSLCATK